MGGNIGAVNQDYEEQDNDLLKNGWIVHSALKHELTANLRKS